MSDNPWHDYDELTRNGWVYQHGEYVKVKPAVGVTTKNPEKN